MLLTSCEKVNSKPDLTIVECPDLVTYSKETQQAIADELANNDIPNTAEAMADYFVMREQVRACN